MSIYGPPPIVSPKPVRAAITNPVAPGRIPKVAILTPVVGIGGTERWLLDIVGGLHRTGQAECEVIVVGGRTDARTMESIAKLCPVWPMHAGEVERYLDKSGFNLTISWGITELPLVVGRFRPNVIAVHGSDDAYSAVYPRSGCDVAGLFVAVSEAARRPLVVAGVPEWAVRVVPNAVNPRRVRTPLERDQARALLSLTGDDYAVGFVGRFSGEKRADLLVRAVNRLGPPYRAVMMGEGPQAEQLRAMDRGHRCHWLPARWRIGDVLAALDCYYGGGADEGYWYGGAEAAMAGVPLVTTRVGFLCDAPRDSGLFVELPRNLDATDVMAGLAACRRDPPNAAGLRGLVAARTMDAMAADWGGVVRLATGSTAPACPLVSIMMPVRDTPVRMLEACWASIQSQTLRQWELVVVDDASTASETLRVMERMADDVRVRLIRRREPGLSASLNAGLVACRADLVAYMDSDDLMMPDRLAVQVELMESHPDWPILGGQIEPFDDASGQAYGATNHASPVDASDVARRLAALKPGEHLWLLSHPAVIYRRSQILALGGYPTEYEAAQDLALWLRAVRAGCVLRSDPRVVVQYRQHGGQMSRGERHHRACERIMRCEWSAPRDGSKRLVRRFTARLKRAVG